MKFLDHKNIVGQHSFLSPSTYHWIRYDDEKLLDRLATSIAARRGTRFHELAHELIELKVNLPKTKKTLNNFVNDVIGYGMNSEVMLYFSQNCFGTADAIGFKRNQLRIFDLKTGESKASVDQLLVYGALFCLEYGFKPFELDYDFRIYQSDEVAMFEVDPVDIAQIMAKIQHFDQLIETTRLEQEV